MSRSHVLVVVVDGLRASALGAYGNTSYPTPTLDAFAAQSVLFDQCFAPTADLAGIYAALLGGRHPLRGHVHDAALSLPRRFELVEYETTIVGDEPLVVESAGAAAFQIKDLLGKETDDDELPTLARRMASACGIIQQAGQSNVPQLVWVHLQGLYGVWDAPIELQQTLLDDEDGSPIEAGAPPDFVLTDRGSADEAYRYSCGYAAQVMLLDESWSGLSEAIDASGRENDWLVMLIGARGFPLGEHGRVGGVDERLYAEQLHVPWLIRFPDRRGRLMRCANLVSHFDLLPTLAAWLEDGSGESQKANQSHVQKELGLDCDGLDLAHLIDGRGDEWRNALLSTARGARSLRTGDWSLREVIDDQAATNLEAVELFVRPDDRWEANDVAARCPEIVAELSEFATAAARQIERGERMPALLAAERTPRAE